MFDPQKDAFMKILLAVDGSQYTKKMLAYLATHEKLFSISNSYTLLTVSPQLPSRARAAAGKGMVETYHREVTKQVLRPVTKFLLRHGIDAKTVAKVGHAGEMISNAADSGKFDLVVMGSHGHGLWANLIMGSVATQVLANCKVPVLLVR
jgi:nucleotide-binding universal stress UspA family protein